MLFIGVVASLFVHILIMLILSMIYRWSPAGNVLEPVQYEFAILQEEELTRLEPIAFDELTTAAIIESESLPEDSADLSPDIIPAVELDFATGGAMPPLLSSASDSAFDEPIPTPGGSGPGEVDLGDIPTPGGSGSGEASGGEAGGVEAGGEEAGGDEAGASFFGITSRGTRIAYIVDISGSMNGHSKMSVTKRELSESIQGLPDHAQFFVVLFSDHLVFPPFQGGWLKARKSNVSRFIHWLDNDVSPWGGTEPLPAFHLVFELDRIGGRPDVIFFLTDGKIKGLGAKDVAALNDQGERVVINTIAFGNQSSQNLLKKIASESGGVYRFVSGGSR